MPGVLGLCPVRAVGAWCGGFAMTPAARVAAAIEILEDWQAGEAGLDRVLMAWARGHRFAGSGDRRAIGDLVYDAVRRQRSACWVAGAEGARAMMRGSLMLDGQAPGDFFTGERHAPALLAEQERAPARDPDMAPRPVRLDYPDWLAPELAQIPDAALAVLQSRAPVDLRVNCLKGSVEAAQALLATEGIMAEPVRLAPHALRVREGARRVAGSEAYRRGLIEIQDVASQAVAAFAGARPGMVVLDLCAGGGGKTLALGASMAGEGRLLAHDISPGRMKDLPGRAGRAGVSVDLIGTAELSAWRGRCDLVVVDAPCSGSGAWRRNPDGKWRLTPTRLSALEQTQAGLLDQAATLAGPAGRVAYMTCSILARENGAQVASFLDRADDWRQAGSLTLGPLDGGDGFFAARLVGAGTAQALTNC